MSNPLRQTTRIHKDERRPVLFGNSRNAVVDLRPNRIGGNSAQFIVGHLNLQIQRSPMAHIHNVALRRFKERSLLVFRSMRGFTHKKLRDLLQGPLRGRQTNADQPLFSHHIQAFQRQRQMRPAFIGCQRMNLIHDHGMHPG